MIRNVLRWLRSGPGCKVVWVTLGLACTAGSGLSQSAERAFNPTRFWTGTAVVAVADVSALVGLNNLWYKQYPRESFHWHNDWDNWAQQDKLGHLVATYQQSRILSMYGRWSGLSRNQAAWYGAGLSFFFQAQIEILDGLSSQWGASWPDLVFNAAGSALAGIQTARPDLDVVALRYSYHKSEFYDSSVSIFGNGLKDYDGTSHWLAIRLGQLAPLKDAGWPGWLGISIGYGADGLAFATPREGFEHRRELYLGIDLDLRGVNWPQPWMKTAASVLSFIRIPAPAIQFLPDARFHLLYY